MNSRHTLRTAILRTCSIIMILACLCPNQAAGAALTAQAVKGVVDTAEETMRDWTPLLVTQNVDQGYAVRTDFASLTDLLGDDGSILNIDEATQLIIREFEFNPDRRIRIARFSILEGVVTAEAAHFDYAVNIFEIETPTVVAGFKFSKAGFAVDKAGNTDISIYNGRFEIRYIGPATGRAQIAYTTPGGIASTVAMGEETAVSLATTSTGYQLKNIGHRPITLMVGGQSAELSPLAGIEVTMQDGLPVIINTSEAAGASVTVGGVLIGPNGTLTLTQTATRAPSRPGSGNPADGTPEGQSSLASTGAANPAVDAVLAVNTSPSGETPEGQSPSASTGAANPFIQINSDNISGSVPIIVETGIQSPGIRPQSPQTATVTVDITGR